MKTKIVYSLVSDSEDHFLEQLLMSTYSVKHYNPDAHIVLVTDKMSNEGLVGDRENALKYINEKMVIDTPELGKKSRSRWLKTSIRQIVKGDYLFIDTDTIVTCDISEIDGFDIKVGAVLDRHLPLNRNQRGDAIIKQCKRSGWKPEDTDYNYFNSGVMLVRDCEESYELYKNWHIIWENSFKRGIDIDQPALGLANKRLGYVVKELDGTWNCQVLGNGLRFMHEAKILHYYNTDSRTILHSNPFIFSEGEFQKKICISNFHLSEDMKQMILHPHRQFTESYEIIAHQKMEAYTSPVVAFVMRGYKNKSFCYRFLFMYTCAIDSIKGVAKRILK